MNNDLAMIMADCDTPYAIVPNEMVGIDGEYGTVFDMMDKLHEVNTVLRAQSIAVVPSFIENVEGLFLVQYNQELSSEAMTVIEMFVQPVIDNNIIERIGAEELANLLLVEKV